MFAPKVTKEQFDACYNLGLTRLGGIGRLNDVHCRKLFKNTVPIGLQQEDSFNAYLVIKNANDRFKYLGLVVEEKAGRLHIIKRPLFIWTGYMKYLDDWYAVESEDLIRGFINHNQIIPLTDIET